MRWIVVYALGTVLWSIILLQDLDAISLLGVVLCAFTLGIGVASYMFRSGFK